jgi:hypothetical protein
VKKKQDPMNENAAKDSLNLLAKIFKNYVADQSGNDGNHEIGGRENIINGENQALSLAIATSKLPHQKV